jgi:hypothetical protein
MKSLAVTDTVLTKSEPEVAKLLIPHETLVGTLFLYTVKVRVRVGVPGAVLTYARNFLIVSA